jgi:DNA ligase D-like protein (predicted ligase)
MPPRVKASFIEPMLLARTDTLPGDRKHWSYELKVDGYRAIAYRADGPVFLRSRNNHDFSRQYPSIVQGLARLPADTVVDGELVALDERGKPSFNLLQHGPGKAVVLYFVFDVMIVGGRDVRHEPLTVRRDLLVRKIVPKLAEPVRHLAPLDEDLDVLVHSVKTQGFEGLIAKRRDSLYEAGERSGSWLKMRVNQGQEFVIGGYTVGSSTFDAVVFGYYEGGRLIYAGRTRSGFTPALRAQLFKSFRAHEINVCPFTNLPEKNAGRWGQGLTKAKMADCRWLSPVLVGQFEFVEWTGEHHLRHSKFIGLRHDRDAIKVVRERSRGEGADDHESPG